MRSVPPPHWLQSARHAVPTSAIAATSANIRTVRANDMRGLSMGAERADGGGTRSRVSPRRPIPTRGAPKVVSGPGTLVLTVRGRTRTSYAVSFWATSYGIPASHHGIGPEPGVGGRWERTACGRPGVDDSGQRWRPWR